jgi:hypothetical protein
LRAADTARLSIASAASATARAQPFRREKHEMRDRLVGGWRGPTRLDATDDRGRDQRDAGGERRVQRS